MKTFIIAFFLLTSIPSFSQRFKIVANLSGEGEVLNIKSIDPSKITHLIYTYATITNGKVASDISRTNDDVNLKNLQTLKTINPDLKILISIGGDKFSGAYAEATSTDENRELLITSILAFIEKYQLDGVELNWVMIPTGKFENKYSATDHYNYALLIEDLRVALDDKSRMKGKRSKYFYTLCVGGSNKRQYLMNSKFKFVIDDIDFINMQTYDYNVEILSGGGVSKAPISGHHCNLYGSRSDAWPRRSVDQTITEYKTFGLPLDKLVLGIAFHGRGWMNAHDAENGLCQMSDGPLVEDFSYRAIQKNYLHQKGFKHFWDKHAKASYLYNKDSAVFISYEDKHSIRKKTSYIRKHKLAGANINALQEDHKTQLATSVKKGLKRIRLPF